MSSTQGWLWVRFGLGSVVIGGVLSHILLNVLANYYLLTYQNRLPILPSSRVSINGSPLKNIDVGKVCLLGRKGVKDGGYALSFCSDAANGCRHGVCTRQGPSMIGRLKSIKGSLRVCKSGLCTMVGYSGFVRIVSIRATRRLKRVGIAGYQCVAFGSKGTCMDSCTNPIKVSPGTHPKGIIRISAADLTMAHRIMINCRPRRVMVGSKGLCITGSNNCHFPSCSQAMSIVSLGAFRIVGAVSMTVGLRHVGLSECNHVCIDSEKSCCKAKSSIFVVSARASHIAKGLKVTTDRVYLDKSSVCVADMR